MLRKTLVAGALALCLVLVGAVPAYALFAWRDGFEASSPSWIFESYAPPPAPCDQYGCYSDSDPVDGFISDYSPLAHSGTHYAYLRADLSSAWSGVGQLVHLPVVGQQCVLSANILPMSSDSHSHVLVNLEVIDPNTWYYIGLSQMEYTSLNVSYQYQSVRFVPHTADIYVRVSVLGPRYPYFHESVANVDDVAVGCV
jgi:hypothetical protein